MTGQTQQPLNGASEPADCSSIVVVASSADTQRRISGALAQQDLQPLAEVDSPGEIDELAMETSTIVVFACDVDAPREMASLRRMCRDARQTAIVVISPPATGTAVRRALDAGADGLVFDPELERALAPTVRAVSIGQSVVPGKFRASVEKPVLSHRENQVLTLVRAGLTNAEIAERLFLAESTIKSHLSSIFTKFGVRSRKEVAAAVIDFDSAPEATIPASSNGSAERATA
ncbi:MAG TPA: response regulator transcription factor [Solirubrobacterales bacterium]|nr:response regulator transcription factor [Solirubrobacterales bacterium]